MGSFGLKKLVDHFLYLIRHIYKCLVNKLQKTTTSHRIKTTGALTEKPDFFKCLKLCVKLGQ
jgi:hypothetical protein